MTSILLISTIQSWFFIFLILRFKTERQLSDRILIFWFALIGLHTFIYFIFLQGIRLNSHFLIFSAAFPFLQGPLLYLYTLAKAGRIKKIRGVHIIHAVPFAVFLSHQLFQLYFPAQDVNGDVHYVTSQFLSPSNPFGILFLILSPVYLFLSYRQTFHPQKVVENINWIRLMVLFFACIWVSSMISFFSPDLLNHQWQIGLNYLIFITLTGFIYLVSYLGLKENYFATDIPKIGKVKYEKSRLSEDEVMQIWNRLSENMNLEKSYLDPSLNLTELSNTIGTTSNKLSQVLNLKEGKSFNDFINAFRVEHAKGMISSGLYDHYTILAIGYDSGFSSKSTFNRVFKNLEGKTPSEFLTLVKQDK